MTQGNSSEEREIFGRIARDVLDNFDEELELESRTPEESHPAPLKETDAEKAAAHAARKSYFREDLPAAAQLVKLQDWLQHSTQKIVVLFEGAMPPARAA